MAIRDTIDLLQAVWREVDGVVFAPALRDYPVTVTPANLPMVLTIPSTGTFFHLGPSGGDAYRHNRTYEVILVVEPYLQNSMPDNMDRAVTVWQNLIEAILDPNTIALANVDTTMASVQPYQVTVMDSENAPHSDGGLVGNVEIGGVPHWGVVLRVTVREWWRNT